MRKNDMKRRLKAGEVLLGAFNTLHAPSVLEILGLVGLDFVIVDAEHTSITPETAEDLYRAAELRELSVVTRIGENSQQVIQKFMDAGSQGVLIPLVNTVEEAQRVVDAVKYPPIGKRGLAGSRSAEWGLTSIPADYVTESNLETLIAVQIETKEGIENFDEIVTVNDVDVIFFGPSDISTSLGYPGELRHPEVLSIIETLGGKSISAGKSVGTIARDRAEIQYWKDRGFQWLCTGVSGFLTNGIRSYISDS